jgi:hypothetical protein
VSGTFSDLLLDPEPRSDFLFTPTALVCQSMRWRVRAWATNRQGKDAKAAKKKK